MKKQNIGAGMTLFVLIICMNVAILIMRKTNFRQLFFKVVCHNFNSTITKFGTFKGVCENINTNNLPVSAALLNNWVEDNEFDAFLRSMEEENILPCDFQSANFSDSMHLQKFLDFDQPIILNGFTANWTAFKFWGKRRLRSKYGKRVIQTDSTSSIVFSGGTAGEPKRFSDVMDSISSASSGHRLKTNVRSKTYRDDTFIFDTRVLQTIPELRKHFSVPLLFHDWDTPSAERDGLTWHMLSFGPSRTGLPMHSHGQTWLAIVHGAKKWFVYPPGSGLPLRVEASLNPLLPSAAWVNLTHEQTKALSKPPGYNQQTCERQDNVELGYRPLQCVQREGQVVFLPAGWSHQTINIGETIAVGGQASLPAPERLRLAIQSLACNPMNFEALKDYALSQAHLAMAVSEKLVSGIESSLPSTYIQRSLCEQLRARKVICILHSERQSRDAMLRTLLAESGSSILAIYSPMKNALSQEDLLKMGTLARLLSDIVAVAYIQIPQQEFPRDGLSTVTTPTNEYLFKVHLGEKNKPLDGMKPAVDSAGTNVIDEGMLELDEYAIQKKVEECMAEHELQRGHALVLSVRASRLLADAVEHLSKALTVRPLHPEAHGLMAEILGLAGNITGMRERVQESVELFSRSGVRKNVSDKAVAAVIHKLATTFLGKEMYEDAIPILRRSLEIMPSYVPALADTVTSFLKSSRKPQQAEKDYVVKTYYRLAEESPYHPSLKSFKKALQKLLAENK